MMKKIYQIETGDFRKEVIASCFEEAIISAFAVEPPKNPAMLVRMRMKNPVKGNKEHIKQARWHYQEIKSALKLAGYGILRDNNLLK
ncbi:MAG: hypothetical protein AABY22_12275 [Nanoarchaeota archaeon]